MALCLRVPLYHIKQPIPKVTDIKLECFILAVDSPQDVVEESKAEPVEGLGMPTIGLRVAIRGTVRFREMHTIQKREEG